MYNIGKELLVFDIHILEYLSKTKDFLKFILEQRSRHIKQTTR